MGHVVVIVGYDPVRGFKVKMTDENDGKVDWIPENRLTWFQSIVTEEIYQAVLNDFCGPNGTQITDQNGQTYFFNRCNIIGALQNAHQVQTGEQLGTDFNQRRQMLLKDIGFALKFKKTCQCQGDTCK